MCMLRNLLVAALVLGLTSSVDAADKAKKGKGKKGTRRAVGTVVAVDKDKNTVTVNVVARKKKGDTTPATATEKTFTVSKDTKFEKVTGKKKNRTTTEAKIDDLNKGLRVRVKANGDNVEGIRILPQAKKKKAKKNAQ